MGEVPSSVSVRGPGQKGQEPAIAGLRSEMLERAKALGIKNLDIAFTTADDIKGAGIAERAIQEEDIKVDFSVSGKHTRANVCLQARIPANATAQSCLDSYAAIRISVLASALGMRIDGAISRECVTT